MAVKIKRLASLWGHTFSFFQAQDEQSASVLMYSWRTYGDSRSHLAAEPADVLGNPGSSVRSVSVLPRLPGAAVEASHHERSAFHYSRICDAEADLLRREASPFLDSTRPAGAANGFHSRVRPESAGNLDERQRAVCNLHRQPGRAFVEVELEIATLYLGRTDSDALGALGDTQSLGIIRATSELAPVSRCKI